MSSSVLLVDGRVLDDDHPGVRRFWVPVLRAWATLGGRGFIAHRRGCVPEEALIAAGFSAIELHHAPYDPRGVFATRSIVRRSAATVTLSPLYLTLDGARRNVGTVFDLAGRSYPRSLRSRLLWEVMMRRTMRASSRIVCATAAAGDELVQTFPRLRNRIAVVPAVAPSPPSGFAAPEPEPLPEPEPELAELPSVGRTGHGLGQGLGLGLDRPYALAVASHRPHKRLSALAAAWRASGTDAALVVLGAGTERLHAPPLIQGLGFVSDAEVDDWFANAACLVSASLVEGFGLPVLAALAGRIPVVATRHAALEEVAGDAVVWLAADDVDGLVSAAQAVIADPAAVSAQVERGRIRAQTFTATQAAQRLARALE